MMTDLLSHLIEMDEALLLAINGWRAAWALGRRFWTLHRGCTSTRSPTSS